MQPATATKKLAYLTQNTISVLFCHLVTPTRFHLAFNCTSTAAVRGENGREKWQGQTGAFVTGCETAKCARRGIGLRTTRLFDVKTHAAKKREGIDAAGLHKQHGEQER
jgi:hypothetical protein